MRLVDLSMPIWEGAGYGEVLAMPNTSVRFYEYMTYDWHGIRRTELKLDDESGSPMMTIWQRAPHTSGPIEEGGAFTWHIDEVPLDRGDHSAEEHALLAEHIVAYRIDGPLFFAAAHDFLPTNFFREYQRR